MSEIICGICPHHCRLREGEAGFCRARRNAGGKNVPDSYGRITSLALDPIEKKPLRHFYPGSMIISAGSYGCSLACPFCQNASISMADADTVRWRYISPKEMADIVMGEPRSIGLAFTYNEPLISWEYIADCASLLKPHGKKIVLVTNGMAEDSVLDRLLPLTDAMNIDLKGSEAFYRDELKGSLQTVKNTIRRAASVCHVEVTILVIPGKNDDPQQIAAAAEWLASCSPDIVCHLSRYFPCGSYTEPPTPRETIIRLQRVVQRYLKCVYTGNM